MVKCLFSIVCEPRLNPKLKPNQKTIKKRVLVSIDEGYGKEDKEMKDIDNVKTETGMKVSM